MASAQPKLRVIEGGGGDPRVAFGSAPSVLAASEADRIPRFAHRFTRFRAFLAITLSCAVHAGIVAAGMQWKASDEARAEGGSADEIVMDGVSVVMLDSAPSAASDGAESLPEAASVPSPSAVQVAEAEVVAAAAETAAAPVTEEPPQAKRIDDAVPVALAEPETRIAVAYEATRAVEESTASDAVVASRIDQTAPVVPVRPATAAAVSDQSTQTIPRDDVAHTVDDAAIAVAGTDAPSRSVETAEPLLEIPEVTALRAPGDTAAETAHDERAKIEEAETRVAAVDITESQKLSAAEKPKPAAEKPVAKTKPSSEPKPAQRSVERPASTAEDTARGPQPGTAGAGGSSKDERGSANLSSYQAKLAARLRSFRSFPAEAEKQGITGTAVVTFTVNASGTVTSAKLGRSSGHAVLDSAAVAMVHRASPFPPIPASLDRNSLTVSAPVRFDMR